MRLNCFSNFTPMRSLHPVNAMFLYVAINDQCSVHTTASSTCHNYMYITFTGCKLLIHADVFTSLWVSKRFDCDNPFLLNLDICRIQFGTFIVNSLVGLLDGKCDMKLNFVQNSMCSQNKLPLQINTNLRS